MKLPFFKDKSETGVYTLRNEELRERMRVILSVSSTITSRLDLDEILQTTVNEMVRTMGYFGGVIFLVDKESNILRSRTLSETWYTRLALKVIQSPFASLYVPMDPETKNLAVQTVLQKKYFVSPNLSDFVIPALTEGAANMMQRLTGHKSGITVPLLFGEEALGAIMFTKNIADNFEADLEFIEAFARQVAIAIRNSALYTQAADQVTQLALQNAELSSLNNVTKNIVTLLNAEEILQVTADSIPKQLGYLGVLIATLDDSGKELRVRSISNNPLTNAAITLLGRDKSEFPILMDDPAYQHIMGVRAVKEGISLISEDFTSAFTPPLPATLVRNIVRVLGAKSIAVLPLRSSSGTIGVVGFLLSKSASDVSAGSQGFMEAFTHVVGIALDNAHSFTEKTRLLADLEQKVDELEEVARKERDMLDILGHELRTPVSTARNYFDMLAQGIQPIPGKLEPEKFAKYVNTIRENIKREINLMETMLSSTKVERNSLQLKSEPVAVAELVDILETSFRPESDKKGLILEAVIPREPLFALGDKDRIIEVMSNLVSNAIKYTHAGTVKIEASVKDGQIGIAVVDSGIGIPAEDMENLGKKFFRVNQHIDNPKDQSPAPAFTRPGGTGLGLYVAFGLAKRMNGNIEVGSTIGRGSTFRLWLPQTTEQPVPEVAAPTVAVASVPVAN